MGGDVCGAATGHGYGGGSARGYGGGPDGDEAPDGGGFRRRISVAKIIGDAGDGGSAGCGANNNCVA